MSIEETIRQIVREEVSEAVDKIITALNDLNKKEKDGLITRYEASSVLKVSLATLNNWEKTGKIKPHRIGRRVYFKESEILKP